VRNLFNRYPFIRRFTGVALLATGAVALGVIRPWESDTPRSEHSVLDQTPAAPLSPWAPTPARKPRPAASYSLPPLLQPSLGPTAKEFVEGINDLPRKDQLDVLIGRICAWREADLAVGARHGHLPHSAAVADLEAYYSWTFAVANGLEDQRNDGGQIPNYSRSAIFQRCPQTIIKPVG
jgi:hypothetical protein